MTSSSAPIESTTAITPPEGWTDDEAHLHTTYYWADKPGTVRDALKKSHGLSKVEPIWTRYPDTGVLFIFQGYNPNNQLRYYLWNGMEDTVAQFVEVTLESIKDEINSEHGSLKNVKFEDVEEIE